LEIATSGLLSRRYRAVSMDDFRILKKKKIPICPPPAPKILEINWFPPSEDCIKCNTDRNSPGNPGHSSCSGIVRDNISNFLGGFSTYIGVDSALAAEILIVIFALEPAERDGRNNFWLESDP